MGFLLSEESGFYAATVRHRADLDTPVSAFRKLEPFSPHFLLESVEGGVRLARYSFIGFGDALSVRLRDGKLEINGQKRRIGARS